MSARQSDVIQALTDVGDANLQFGRLRWTYLTFLNDPNKKTFEVSISNIDKLKERLVSLRKLEFGDGLQDLDQKIASLEETAQALKGGRDKARHAEEMTLDAMTSLGRIDEILSSTSETLKAMLTRESEQTLRKTVRMQNIPVIFILGGVSAVVFALTVIILNILLPIDTITSVMAAASRDAVNARNYLLPVDRSDEIGDATKALNHLLEQMSASIDRVRQTENLLSHAQRMEMMGRMSGGIAHDFNNMLIVISGNLELIERRIGDNPEVKEMIEAALSSVDKGRDLTQRILVFSRKQILKPENINVNKNLPDIIELIRRVVREDVAIETVMENGLWNIQADPIQLESALLNLAINSRDAIPGNEGKITICTENVTVAANTAPGSPSIPPGQYVMVSLADNGTGIPSEIIDQIFDPFFTTKEPGKGTGLGLSMVYGFTRQSGGHVTIDSTVNKGTTIRLYFPRSTEEGAVAEYHRHDLFPEQVVGGNESLLVVEDRRDVLKYLSSTLRQLGYRVTTAKDGVDALRRLQRRKHLDMLITDVVMPGQMNGEELAVEVKKKFPNTKVLYISGYTRDALVDQGALKPDVHLLLKPFNRADLATRIRAMFESVH
ncbi:MAG TPA: ATP-binding protein [Micavibrio sp.]